MEVINREDAKFVLSWYLMGDCADKAKKLICELPYYNVDNDCLKDIRNPKSSKSFKDKVLTNADRLRSMTNEELAEFLSQLKGSTLLFHKQGYDISVRELASLNWLNAPYTK